MAYAVGLGDDAIPSLVRVLPALPDADRAALDGMLRTRRAILEAEPQAWPSWSLGRQLARDALAAVGR